MSGKPSPSSRCKDTTNTHDCGELHQPIGVVVLLFAGTVVQQIVKRPVGRHHPNHNLHRPHLSSG
jgi:hypothetical protein